MVFSRVLAHGHVEVALSDHELEAGDLLHTVGPAELVEAVAAELGGEAVEAITPPSSSLRR